MSKKLKLWMLLLAVVLFFSISTAVYIFLPGKYTNIIVRKGETLGTISSKLKNNNLIISKRLFVRWANFTGVSKKLQAGIYTFSNKDSMFSILRTLKQGSKDNIRLTVPEGNTIDQTASIILQQFPIDKKKFIEIAMIRNLEGYLMPETYFVVPGVNEEQLINMMYNEFNRKVTPEMLRRAKEINMDFRDIVILASLIEKESVSHKERSMISAVFYNRLKKRIKLQSCATVLYAMGTNKKKLSLKDTKFKSPYNTYLHYRLPPGPICSPGIVSINAALYPDDIKSLFFVAKGDGEHLFADNLEEHLKNKRKVLKINKQ